MTVSRFIESTQIGLAANITKIVLKENLTNVSITGASKVTDWDIGDGCSVGAISSVSSLVNVKVGSNVTLNFSGRAFQGAKNLTSESITNILKCSNYPNELFFNITFASPTDIIIPENSNISSQWLFYRVYNVNSIVVKKNSVITCPNTSYSVFEMEKEGAVIDSIILEENSNVACLLNGSWHYAWKVPTINKLKVEDNVKINDKCFFKVNIKEVEIGKNVTFATANAFNSCNGIEKITLHLTDEQVQDNTIIPEIYKKVIVGTTATVSDTIIDNENKTCTWYITYPAA